MSPGVRRRVHQRAGGRCEYCHFPARYDITPMQVDHIVAKQHRGGASFTNLALICAHCNRHKGPNLAGIDRRTRTLTRLFNPRADAWGKHFQWRRLALLGLTDIGRTTIEVLAINAELRVSARAELFVEGLAREFA